MRASEDFVCAEKLSAAEQIKPDCCRTPAVVSILLTQLPVSCPSTTPHHYIYTELIIFYRQFFLNRSLVFDRNALEMFSV